MYQHRLNRLKLLIKSSLVGLIHEKTMNSPSISYDNGESTTLMSTDTDSLDGVAEMFHETWAQIIEVIVGVTLLAGEVGWLWPLPLFLILRKLGTFRVSDPSSCVEVCSRVSRYVANHLQSRQKAWNNATQSRVAATSTMLSSIKTIKMLGLQQHLTDHILELRRQELSVAAKLRWMMVYYNASGQS
jgi:ATP-binding cassette subfamily C (CFTR/MRP) protein 1